MSEYFINRLYGGPDFDALAGQIARLMRYAHKAEKLIPENAVQLGAAWLIGELLLFFIPPVISVIKYEGLFEQYGTNILFTLVMGSVCVMFGTGFVVDRVFRFERQLNIKKQARRHAKAA